MAIKITKEVEEMLATDACVTRISMHYLIHIYPYFQPLPMLS